MLMDHVNTTQATGNPTRVHRANPTLKMTCGEECLDAQRLAIGVETWLKEDTGKGTEAEKKKQESAVEEAVKC